VLHWPTRTSRPTLLRLSYQNPPTNRTQCTQPSRQQRQLECHCLGTFLMAMQRLMCCFPNNQWCHGAEWHQGKCLIIVNNSRNMTCKHDSKQSSFADNCGSWDTAKRSTKKHQFVITSCRKVRFIQKQEGQYYTNHKNPNTVLVPKGVSILKRYYKYATVKRETHRDKVQHSVVEYGGTFPKDTSLHRNAKTATG